MLGGLTFYADQPARRTRQVVGDLLVPVWVALWVWVGTTVHARSAAAGQGAAKLETAGGDFAGSMTDAGSRLQRVPVVGEELRPPFDRAATAGSTVQQAGRDIQTGTDQLGQLLGLLTAALPILLVLSFWALARWRYAQRVRLARAIEAYDGPDVAPIKAVAGLDLASLGLNPRAAGPVDQPPVDQPPVDRPPVEPQPPADPPTGGFTPPASPEPR